ncbi:hypothetical protein [Natrinema sp. SYSU A 869]|uniref:hypothetical protein n=1 Tax=Natrinema sp. SYSU A 869 TaxID=2871694 RepID=UPI001CA405FB|nr:hypothetical protein [Natrinema sp. SYSU A 869]
MSEFTDRLLILIIAVVGLGSLIVAWFGGFVMAGMAGWMQTVGLAALVALFLLSLVAVWHEFNDIDRKRS